VVLAAGVLPAVSVISKPGAARWSARGECGYRVQEEFQVRREVGARRFRVAGQFAGLRQQAKQSVGGVPLVERVRWL
jgi:hypothetical protein